MDQQKFNDVVKVLTRKIKPGEEWNIDLSQNLKKYQEYALRSDFGGIVDGESSRKFQGNFIEAGLVVENASQIYALRVDDAFETTVSCAQSLRRTLLHSENSAEKARKEKVRQNESESSGVPKTKPVLSKNKRTSKKSDTAHQSSFSFDLVDQINQVTIKVDDNKRQILDEPYACTKVVPLFIQHTEKVSKHDPINDPIRNNYDEVTSFKYDYLINTSILNECLEKTAEVEAEGEETLQIKKIGPRKNSSRPSVADSGFGSGSHVTSNTQDSAICSDFDTHVIKHTGTSLTAMSANFDITLDSIDSLLRNATSFQKQIEPLLTMTPKPKTIVPTLQEFSSTHTFTGSSTVTEQVEKELEQQVITKTISQQLMSQEIDTVEREDSNKIKERVTETTPQKSPKNHTEQADKIKELAVVNETLQKSNQILSSQYNMFNIPSSMILAAQSDFELPALYKTKSGFESNEILSSQHNLFKIPSSILAAQSDFELPPTHKSKSGFKSEEVLSSQHNLFKITSSILAEQSDFEMTPMRKSKSGFESDEILSSQHNLFKIPSSILSAESDFELPPIFKKYSGFLQLPLNSMQKNIPFSLPKSMKLSTLKRRSSQINISAIPVKVVVKINNVEKLTNTIESNEKNKSEISKNVSENIDEVEMGAGHTLLSNDTNESSIENNASPKTHADNTVVNERNIDDYVDEGFFSPGSEFSNDYNDMPDEANYNVDMHDDSLRETIAPLNEVLPMLEKVSMLNRMNEDLSVMAGMPPSPPSPDYEGFDNVEPSTSVISPSVPGSKTTECSLNGCVYGVPSASSPSVPESETTTSCSLPRQKNLSEQYRVEDVTMARELQEWSAMVKPRVAQDQANVFQLEHYKTKLLHHMTTINHKYCTMRDILHQSNTEEAGRYLLAALQLTNENKLRILESNKPEGIGNPCSIAVRFHSTK